MGDVDRASAALFGARVVAQALGFLAVIYFARVLGSAGLGIYFTFQTVVSVSGVFSKFGVPGALVKRISQSEDPRQRGAYLTGAFLLVAVPFTVISALVLLFGDFLRGYVGLGAVVPMLILVLAISNGNRMFISTLRGENRVAVTAGIELLGQVVRIAASVALLLLGLDVIALVYGLAASGAAQALVASRLIDTGFAIPTRDDIHHLFGFSKYTAGMNVSNLAYNWADTLVLAAFATKSVVGVYETAWQLTAVTLFAAQSIGVSLAPTVTRWHENGEVGKIEAAFTQGVTYALALVVPAVVGAAVLGDSVLTVLYDFETIGAGALVLLALMSGQLAQAVKNITQNTLFGIDRPGAVFWTNALSLGANLGLNVLLVPRYGMLGAAAATVATASVAAVSQVVYLRRHVALRLDARNLGWQVGFALLMGAVVAGLARVVPPENEAGLFVLVGAGVAVYGLGLLANADIRERLLRSAPL